MSQGQQRTRLALLAALLLAPASTADLRPPAAMPPAAWNARVAERTATTSLALDEARLLAREGRFDEAIAQYDRLFLGSLPPGRLAIEYLGALSEATGGWEAGRDGLAALVRHDPADLAAQFGYAETLVQREATRADGIERLQALTRQPAVAEAAGRAWRAAQLPLASAVAGGPKRAAPAAPLLQAAAEIQRAELPAAEQTLRAALLQWPGDVGVTVALAGLLDREGRPRDADDLLRQARAAGGGRPVAEARARHWREQAARSADFQPWVTLLRAATQADPADPGVRLELARTLIAAGRLAEARATMAEGVADGASPDALRAGIAFANETGDPDAAAALLARLPVHARTLDLQAARARAALQGQIAGALALGPPAAEDALLAFASRQPDPDGTRGAQIALALAEASYPDIARDAVAAARAATPDIGAAADLAHARALLELGDPVSAQRVLAGLPESAALTSPQQAELADLRTGLAVRRSDALNEQGDPAAAYRALAPALARRPGDPALNVALARLYQGAGRHSEARHVAEALLRRDPANAEARRVVADAALATGQRDRAAVVVQDGVRATPLDPQAWLAEADLARARGDDETGLRALRRARGLRMRQREAGQAATLPETPATAIALAMLAPNDAAPSVGPPSSAPPNSRPADPGPADPVPLSVPPLADPLLPSAGPGLQAETDDDGDQVMVRGRMLDTEATDLPPPQRAAKPAALARPPRPVTMAASLSPPEDSPEASAPDAASGGRVEGAAEATADTAPFGGSSPPSIDPPARPAANPFASQAGPAPAAADPGLPMLADLAAPATPTDPLTARIDRDIAALDDAAPNEAGAGGPLPDAQAAVGFRGRSGSAGTSRLAEITVPLATDLSDGGDGRIRLAVTPTFLQAGSVAQGVGTAAQFGSLALGLRPGPRAIPGQTADGAGLQVGYDVGDFSADVGSTPLGFLQRNVVGGVQWTPSVADGVRLRLTGERRAVTDSLLSYAGVRDPASGRSWGGVTYNRGRAELQFSVAGVDLYVGGGGGVLEGRDVKQNTEAEAGAGGSVALFKDAGQELRLGVDLVYYGFARNLDGFTLGQGGYFSPQSYVAALLPVTFKDHPTEDLSYEVGATAGVQSYRADSSPTFPDNPALQSALRAQQANPATAVPGVSTGFAAQNRTGFAGGAHAAIDYRLTGGFHLGGKLDYEHAGNFNQAVGLLYLRTVFGDAPAAR